MKATFLLLAVGFAMSAHAAVKVKEVAKVGNKSFFMDSDVSRDTDYKLSWDDALSFCNSNNMNLATINSKAEQDALQKWHKTFGPSVYIGASDKFSEGKWYWQHTRDPIKYNNWDENEPQTGEYNSCARMSSSNGKWSASYCDVAYAHPLCEKISSGR